MEIEPNSLWVEVLRGKYWRELGEEGQLIAHCSDSKLWKELAKIWGIYKDNTDLQLRDGEDGRLIWKSASNGTFSVANAYSQLTCARTHPHQKH